jgi:hypothetical protein
MGEKPVFNQAVSLTSTSSTIHGKRWLAVIGCGLTLLWMAQADASAQAQSATGTSAASTGASPASTGASPASTGASPASTGASAASTGAGTATPGNPSASLTQCVTAAGPAERSVTFSGEMTVVPGTARMSMRIELQERTTGETGFHAVVAPGLGVWHTAATDVKTYKYDQQVADLAAPADYRAAVVFRWQGRDRRELKRTQRLTSVCRQPEPNSIPEEAASPISPAGAETPSSSAPDSSSAGSKTDLKTES